MAPPSKQGKRRDMLRPKSGLISPLFSKLNTSSSYHPVEPTASPKGGDVGPGWPRRIGRSLSENASVSLSLPDRSEAGGWSSSTINTFASAPSPASPSVNAQRRSTDFGQRTPGWTSAFDLGYDPADALELLGEDPTDEQAASASECRDAPSRELRYLQDDVPYHAWTHAEAPWFFSYSSAVLSTDNLLHTLWGIFLGGHISAESRALPAPRLVLDLGCGSGVWCIDVARSLWPNAHIIGFDLAPCQVSVPDDLLGRVEWHVGNFLQRLPYLDASFDFVHMRYAGLGVPEQKWDSLLEEIMRILAPGGAVEITEMTYGMLTGVRPRPPLSSPEDHSYDIPIQSDFTRIRLAWHHIFEGHMVNLDPLRTIHATAAQNGFTGITRSSDVTVMLPSKARARLSEVRLPPMVHSRDGRELSMLEMLKGLFGDSYEPNAEQLAQTVHNLDLISRAFMATVVTRLDNSREGMWTAWRTLCDRPGGAPRPPQVHIGRTGKGEDVYVNAEWWRNEEEFERELDEWVSDMGRRIGFDVLVEEEFGWRDIDQSILEGPRRQRSNTWALERERESQAEDDVLATVQASTFLMRKPHA